MERENMKKVVDAGKWLTRNFFLIPIPVFIVIYLRWFLLTPLMFFNDPDAAYIAGVFLFSLYVLLSMLLKRARSHSAVRIFLLLSAFLFFLWNIFHIKAFFPSIESVAECNGKTYYVTWMHPLGDYQWTFNNVTIWKGPFEYESFFFGYSMDSYEIICDARNEETHIITSFTKRLAFTDGNGQRIYDDGARLGNHQYGLSYDYNENPDLFIYVLYECGLDFSDCHILPFQYHGEYSKWASYVAANEEKSELNVYFIVYHGTQSEDVLIFTWGEQPRCYVEGCEIPEKK